MPKILDISYAGELGAANYILGIRDGKAVRFPVEVLEDEPVVNSSFVSLTDTPTNYVDQAGKLAAVNSTETALEFVDPPSSLPAGGATGQVLTKNSATDGDAGWSDTVASFLGLSDTPDTYAPYPGKVVAVKADSSGLEFVSQAGGSSPIVDLSSATSDYALAAGETAKIVYSNVTSVLLHIAASEGEYEISVLGNTPGYSSTANALLLPNNQTLSGLISRKRETKMVNTTVTEQYSNTSTGLYIGAYILNIAKFSVSTITVNKMALGRSVTSYSAIRDYAYDWYSIWPDTTTTWASLGTISFSVAQSGTIIIRRII